MQSSPSAGSASRFHSVVHASCADRRESSEFFCLLLYSPPALVGILAVQWKTHLNSPSGIVPVSPSSIEHRNLLAIAIFYSLATTVAQFFGINSAYLFAMAAGWLTICLIINDYLLPRPNTPTDRSVHLITYCLATVGHRAAVFARILTLASVDCSCRGRH